MPLDEMLPKYSCHKPFNIAPLNEQVLSSVTPSEREISRHRVDRKVILIMQVNSKLVLNCFSVIAKPSTQKRLILVWV